MHKHATRGRHHNNYDLYADLEKIKSAFSDTASDIKGKTGQMFSESFNDLRERSNELQTGVADYAAERPFKSLGIALAVGLALGFLLRK